MNHPGLQSPENFFLLLDRWVAARWLRPLDRVFARWLADECERAGAVPSVLLLLGAALVSHQHGRGHVALDLRQTLVDPDASLSLPPEGDGSFVPPPRPSQVLAGVELHQWQAALQLPFVVGAGAGNTPLVCDGVLLYLRRYWQYEQQIAAAIAARVQASRLQDLPLLRTLLNALFVSTAALPDQATAPDWQKIACALAVRTAFAVITGGPGTGKTTTVVRLLALLQSMALQSEGRLLRIRLAAPTGKAAARLNESIASQVQALHDRQSVHGCLPDAVYEAIAAEKVVTLHRLLGTLPDSRHFRHHAANPLALDVVVVDEASMIDVEMMAALLDALPAQARLVLLGDKDQLASVEAGAVLGRLCARAEAGHYRPDTVAWLAEACGETVLEPLCDASAMALDQCVVMLRHSHRFDAQSGIGRLARAVNDGDSQAALELLQSPPPDVRRLSVCGSHDRQLDRLLVDGYGGYLGAMQSLVHGNQPATDAEAHAILQRYSQFQLLCALRSGEWGVEALNLRAVQVLRAAGLLPEVTREWYIGRPVMVTRNDYSLHLMNGDIGIALPHADGQLRVAFPAGDGSDAVRWVLPSRLVDVETVFAMTVHKAQGSEFMHAALLLPGQLNPVLTRELLYTGITRAKKHFTLIDSSDSVLNECIARRVQRSSGLFLQG